MKEYAELITIIFDIVGLTLISLNLFNIREFNFKYKEQSFDLITTELSNKITDIFINFELINKMRYGFYILMFNQFVKLILWNNAFIVKYYLGQ